MKSVEKVVEVLVGVLWFESGFDCSGVVKVCVVCSVCSG